MFKSKQFYYGLLTVCVLIAIYYFSLKIPEETLEEIITRSHPWGPVIFILLTILTFVLAPISSTPLFFIGYVAFDRNVVFLYLIASIIASLMNFQLARYFGKGFVTKILGESNAGRLNTFIDNHGYTTLFLLRTFQSSLGDYVSYAAGLTNMRFVPYSIVTTLGLIPEMLLLYLFSSKVTTPASFTVLSFLVAGVLVGAYFSVTWVYRFIQFSRHHDKK